MSSRHLRAATAIFKQGPLDPLTPAAHVGRLVGLSPDGVPLVRHRGRAVAARHLATLDRAALRAAAERQTEVLLLIADNQEPVIVGVLAPPGLSDENQDVARVDGKRVVIEGQDEIVLKCGEASITLRRNGKVVIAGAFVESRSTGVQRIKGAAVKVN